eukprot:COSAG01_NODE_29100_length_645_cov_1.175824_2_plen_119_part_01
MGRRYCTWYNDGDESGGVAAAAAAAAAATATAETRNCTFPNADSFTDDSREGLIVVLMLSASCFAHKKACGGWLTCRHDRRTLASVYSHYSGDEWYRGWASLGYYCGVANRSRGNYGLV